jgi:RNA recognition motif-containing protein
VDRSGSPPPAATIPKVPIDYTSIFVGQLDRSTDEKMIRERFGKYGYIVNVQVLSKVALPSRRPDTGGFAFVKYDGREAATRAVKAEVSSREMRC